MKNLVALLLVMFFFLGLKAQEDWSFYHEKCDQLENPNGEQCANLLILEILNRKQFISEYNARVLIEFIISKKGLFKTMKPSSNSDVGKFVRNALSEIEYNYLFKPDQNIENLKDKFYTLRLKYTASDKIFAVSNDEDTTLKEFTEESVKREIFKVVEEMPRFPGCEDKVEWTHAER